MILKKKSLIFLLIFCQILKKVCYVKVLDLLYHLKRLIDFLLQFELLHRDTLQFNLPSEKRDVLKNRLKDICFSTLNSYNFDKANTNLTDSESKSLEELMRRKDLVIQKAGKGNTVVITDRENYFKGITSLLSDKTKLMRLNIDQSKWLNYIVNLEKTLKEHFKTLEKDNKISEDEFKVFVPSAHSWVFHMANLKSTKL